jgi:transglutaminase-like putative cysteine protease
MAHTSGTPLGAGRLIAAAAVTGLAAATAVAFGRVFEGGGTTAKLLGVGIASAALAAAMERRSLVLATVVSFGAALLATGMLVFPETTWWGLPTAETARAIASATAEIGEQARVNVAPTAPVDPLLLAAVTAVWASVFSAHALAFRAGSPLLALVPPIALVAFADTVLEDEVRPLYGILFLLAALLVAFADGLQRIMGWGPVWGAGPRERIVARTGRGGRRLGVIAVVVASATPILMPGFGSRAIVDLSTVDLADPVRLNPLVRIGAELNRSKPRDLFTVRTPVATYHRMMSLQTYDGSSWIPDLREDIRVQVNEGSDLLPIPRGTGDPLGLAYEFTSDPGFPWLPVAYPAARVQVDQDLALDPETSTLWLEEPLRQGDAYLVESEIVAPTPASLDAIAFPPSTAHNPYLAVPPELQAELREIAEEWTADAPSDYRRILAIQERLRGFQYNDDVPARDDRFTIIDFLTETREGYCQQFASSMAMMLRTLGIPSRVAVGFTQGTRVRGVESTYLVSTRDFHSWVEVRFPGYGWLAFEPTPIRSNPAAAVYLEPETTECLPRRGGGPRSGCETPGIDTNVDEGSALVDQRDPRIPTEVEPGIRASVEIPAGQEPAGRPTALYVGAVLAALVLVLLAIPPARALGRRRRLRRAAADPRKLVLVAYDVFTERAADLGFPRGPGETMREYHERLRASGRLSDGELGRLTGIAIRAAYGPLEPGADDAADARAAAVTTLRELRGGTSVAQRLRGWYRRP